jgi:hypothetical protein
MEMACGGQAHGMRSVGRVRSSRPGGRIVGGRPVLDLVGDVAAVDGGEGDHAGRLLAVGHGHLA